MDYEKKEWTLDYLVQEHLWSMHCAGFRHELALDKDVEWT